MVDMTVAEVGSRMVRARRRLRRLVADGRVGTIAGEHRGQLVRLGSEYIEAALLGAGRRLPVVDPSGSRDELVRDMAEVLAGLGASCTGAAPQLPAAAGPGPPFRSRPLGRSGTPINRPRRQGAPPPAKSRRRSADWS